jgi:RHS repeat-associated protein
MRLYFSIAFFLLTLFVQGQTINGSSTGQVGVGTTYYYISDGGTITANWVITNGYTSNSYKSGAYYYTTVTWTASGTGTIKFQDGTLVLATKSVSVAPCDPPAAPSTTFTYNNLCGSTQITYAGTPPSGITWYWETTANGIILDQNNPTYSATSAGVYYLRSMNGCGTMSTTSLATDPVTIKLVPTASLSVPNPSVCTSSSSNYSVTITNNAPSVTNTWTVSSSGVTGYTSSSGVSSSSSPYTYTFNETLQNSGTTNASADYTITPVLNGCSGTPVTTKATVKPLPTPSVSNQTIFSGQTATITPTSTVAGTTYSYTASSIYVNGASNGTTIPVSQLLTCSSPDVIGSVSYVFTATAAGCTGPITATSVVTVYSLPKLLVNGLGDLGSNFLNYGYGITLSTSIPYSSYQWNKDGVAISGANQATYLPTVGGVYSVTVQGALGGSSATSQTTTIVKPNGQVDSVNMISYTRFFKAGFTSSTPLYQLQPSDLEQINTYKDGIGRAIQTVAVGRSAYGGDIVTPMVIGRNGMADTTFLPYTTDTPQGKFYSNAIRGSTAANSYTSSQQYLYYQGTTKVVTDTNPYSRAIFRNTPDARIVEQGFPGADWQPGTSHTLRNQIALSSSANLPVRMWNANGTTSGNYPDKSVTVVVTTDENNNLIRTYTDSRGLTVLKQIQATSSTWLQTYYIYDNFGRLTYQVPPLAVTTLGSASSLDANSNSVAELIYKYTYDSVGNVVEKKIPGMALQWIVYDRLGRVAFTQDGNQRAQGVWMFVKYDYRNRPAYTGVYTSNADRVTLQKLLLPLTYTDYTTQPWYETRAAGSAYQGYTNAVFPTTGIQLLSVNYYDDYDFDQNGVADYTYDNSHLAGLPVSASSQTRGLTTGIKKLILGTSNWLVRVLFYDDHDRPLQTQSNNHLNLNVQDKLSILYVANDLTSHIERTNATHNGPVSITVTQRYTYDRSWNTLGIFHTINSTTETQIVSYTYNALGQVVDKRLHINGGSSAQSVDFRYNIRGWLKSINNAQLANDGIVSNDDTNDFFGMEIFYNNSETSSLGNTPSYNGNISAVKWKNAGAVAGVTDQRSYKYYYDNSDRLINSTFNAYNGTSWTKEQNTLDESATYDPNGNILTLARNQNGRTASGINVTNASQQLDHLVYTYANGNQLSNVSDDAIANSGFIDTPNQASTTEYAYNTHGSLISDKNKGIDSIKYNVLGGPIRIRFSDGRVIVYSYDASGTKLSLTTITNGTSSRTDYIGGFIYNNNVLNFFSMPEGRVSAVGGPFRYQYNIADHLGNTRVVFSGTTPTVQSFTAGFELNQQGPESTNFLNYPTSSHINTVASNAHSGTRSLYLNAGTSGQVGVAKSFKIFPGDQVQIQSYVKYTSKSTTTSNLAGFATALLSAFNLAAPVAGETGTASSAINMWVALEASGYEDGTSNTSPKSFVTILIFDKNYNFLDVAYQQSTSSGALISATYKAKEMGYAFMYVSNEEPVLRDVYFDDITMSYTPTPVVQLNEYYPFGLQTGNSWTRDGNSNNYLANGGTELNPSTAVYDLDFRTYDPVLGRLNQVDPLALNDASLSPYHYSFNNPVRFVDPTGSWGDNGEVADPTPTYMNDPSEYGVGAYKRLNDPSGYGSGMTIAYSTLYSITTGIKDEHGNWIPEYTTRTYSVETEFIEIRDFGAERSEFQIFQDFNKLWKGAPPGEYEVQRKGETLKSIAKRFKISVPNLMKINNITNSKIKFAPGTLLKVDKAFVKFEKIMETTVKYGGRSTKLGSTPLGVWLREELDERRGVTTENSFELEWRSMKWMDQTPPEVLPFFHIYQSEWRDASWELRTTIFDNYQRKDENN